MNLRQLEAFRALMLAGTATGAGDLLRLTQPTISKLISQFERQSGLRMFERVKGRLVPRPEAVALLQQVDRAFAAIEEVGRSAQRLAKAEAGHLRVVAMPVLALNFLPRAIGSFLARRPGVTVTLNVHASSDVFEWIARQQADIGFASLPTAGAGVVIEPFSESDGVVVLPEGHPLAPRACLAPRDLDGMPFISVGHDSTFRHMIDRAFANAGSRRHVVVETGYAAIAATLAATGVGTTIIDPISALDCFDRGGVVLRRFAPRTPSTIHAVFPARSTRSVLLTEFLAHLQHHRQDALARLEAAVAQDVRTAEGGMHRRRRGRRVGRLAGRAAE